MDQATIDRPQVSGLGAVRLGDDRAELERLRGHTLWQALNAAAAPDPDKAALIGADDAGEVSRISYRDLLARIRDFSAGLASIGVRRGDRVVVWMTNTFEWVIATFGAMRIGAAVVPVNTFLKPPEIKYFMEQSGARHLVMIDRFRKLSMPDVLEQICPGVQACTAPGEFFSPDLPDLRNIVLFGRSGGKLASAFDFAALANPGAEALALSDRMEAEVRGSDLGMVKYTSGSTAFPKGVMLEQGGILANGILHGRGMGVRADDVYFSMMPFFHAGGSIYGLMSMLMNGGTLVYTEAFDANLAADLIVREKATIQVTMLAGELMQAAVDKGYVFEFDPPRRAGRRSRAADHAQCHLVFLRLRPYRDLCPGRPVAARSRRGSAARRASAARQRMPDRASRDRRAPAPRRSRRGAAARQHRQGLLEQAGRNRPGVWRRRLVPQRGPVHRR